MKRIVVLLALLSVLWPSVAQTFIRTLPTSTNLTSATKVPVDDATYGTRAVTLNNLLAGAATNSTLLAAITNVVEDTATSLLANKLDATNGTAVNLTGSLTNATLDGYTSADFLAGGAASKLDATNGTAVNLTGTATNLILREVLVPITAYGAVGDGTTDNAAAIETALATGYPLLIPAGTFRVASEVDVPTGARIYGTGQDSIIKTTSTSISAFKLYDVDDVVISDVAFRGASNNAAAASSAGNAIYITQGSTKVRVLRPDVRYFNVGVFVNVSSADVEVSSGSFIGNARGSVNVDGANDVRVLNNYIDGTRTGIGDTTLGMVGIWFQAGSHGCIASGNTVWNLRAEGINLKGTQNTVTANVIEATDNGIICETDSPDVTASDNGAFNAIVGNTITNITGIGIFAGNTIGVNNAVVHHVTVSGNVISGAEYGLSFAGLNSSATNERPYALTVIGNIVENTTVGGGLLINADDSVFADNIIRKAYTDGIQLYRGNNNRLTGNHISQARQNGIYLFTGGTNNAVTGNTILDGGTATANTYDGLRIAAHSYSLVSGNMVTGSNFRYLASEEGTATGTVWNNNSLIGTAGTAVFNFAGTSGTRFNNYGSVININDANSRVGILTSSPGTTMSGQSATLDFRGRYMLLGSDLSADGSRTDDTSKRFAYLFSPYDTTPAVQVIGLLFDSGAANHVISYGGGSSAGYAATRHAWWAGANTATTTGTEVMRLTTTGVSIGYASDPGVALDVNGSIRIAYGSNYQSKDSGGSTKTLMTYSDSSGVILGNGSDPIQLQPGSSGVNLTAVGTTSPVTLKRTASADSGANLKDSNQLRVETSYWDGANNVEVFSRIVGVADSTNGPVYSLVFKDNSGSNTMAITNNGNVTVAGQFKASGGITNTTINGNTVTAGSGTLTLGASKTLTVSESVTLNRQSSTGLPVELIVALSDETTAITTGTAKVTMRAPWAFTITSIRASVNTVSSSGTPAVDINEAGVSIFSTTLTIDANEKTSTTAATAAVISDTAIADDAELTFDIDTAGTGAKGLKVCIYGYR